MTDKETEMLELLKLVRIGIAYEIKYNLILEKLDEFIVAHCDEDGPWYDKGNDDD